MIVPFAVAAVAVMLSAAPNAFAQAEATPVPKHTTKIGYSELPRGDVDRDHLRLVTQTECVYTPAASGKKIENYAGSINKFGG